MEEKWEIVTKAQGSLQAEIIRGLLESQEISTLLVQEAAGKAIGLSIGPMAEVLIMVKTSQKDKAIEIVQNYRNGDFDSSAFPDDNLTDIH